eukprot:246341_1
MSTSSELLDYLGIKHIAHRRTLWPRLFDIKKREFLQQNYIPKSNETWIITYAKNGTTLTQQICHEIMHCVYIKTKSIKHKYYESNQKRYNRAEWIEMLYSTSKTEFDQFINNTKNTIRFWKTHSKLEHLPCCKLPNKMIIVCRNPKDALVSFYHHIKNHSKLSYNSGFDWFYVLWIAGLLENGSYFEYYTKYWDLYVNNRKKLNILWLNYEDLVRDDKSKQKQILKIIKFIGVDDIVNCIQDIEKIMYNTSVNKMKQQYNKKDEVISNFVRKGNIGDWQNYFNLKQNEIMDTLIRLHFNGTKFKYYMDLNNKKKYMC